MTDGRLAISLDVTWGVAAADAHEVLQGVGGEADAAAVTAPVGHGALLPPAATGLRGIGGPCDRSDTRDIPPGTTRSYGEVARAMGVPSIYVEREDGGRLVGREEVQGAAHRPRPDQRPGGEGGEDAAERAGPVERPINKIPMKGFRGFRYTTKLF